MQATRSIESNDGRRVVELRRFDAVRSIKTLSEVESVRIDLGLPDALVLTVLETIQPGSGAATLAVKNLAEGIMQAGGQIALDEQAKAFASVDGLTGKSVRIVYVDGAGIESLEAVDCELTAGELEFLKDAAILGDYYILPDLKFKVGDTWPVDGEQLGGFLDPSLRAVPSGRVTIKRVSDRQEGGKRYAQLEVERGYLKLDASDASQSSVGTFIPRGSLQFNLTDGYIDQGELAGRIMFEQVSKDHLLFEARFRTEPEIKITYACQMK